MNLIQAAQITHKLQEARQAVQFLHGAEWRQKLAPFTAVLEGLHKEKGESYLALGQQIAEEMQQQGINPLMILAATVELIEPSAA